MAAVARDHPIEVVQGQPQSGRICGMHDRVLLYLNTLAVSAVDLAVLIAALRGMPAGGGLLVVAVAALLLPALLAAAVVQHRRLTAALA